MKQNNINVRLTFTELVKDNHFPMTSTDLIADHFRKQGYAAKVTGNRLTVTTIYGIAWEYAVSYEVYGLNWNKDRNYRRIVDTLNHIVQAKLYNLERYINRKTW